MAKLNNFGDVTTEALFKIGKALDGDMLWSSIFVTVRHIFCYKAIKPHSVHQTVLCSCIRMLTHVVIWIYANSSMAV